MQAEIERLQERINELQRYDEFQKSLIEMLHSMVEADDLSETIARVHRELSRIIEVRNLYVALFDPELGRYEFPYFVDEKDRISEHRPEELKKSLTDYVRRCGRAMLIDEQEHQRLMEAGEVDMIGTPSPCWLGIPLRSPEGVIGVLAAQSCDLGKHYAESDLQLLQLVGDNLAVVIERQRREKELRAYRLHLEEQVNQRTRELEETNQRLLLEIGERQQSEALQKALFRIADEASHALDLPAFYQAVHGIVSEWVYARNFYIALFNREKNRLSFPYYVDEFDLHPEGPEELGRGMTEYVLRNGKSLLCDANRIRELEKAGEIELIGTPSVDWLGIPLQNEEGTFGVLVVQSYDRSIRFNERDKSLLTFVSQHIAAAINHLTAQETLRISEKKYRTLFEESLDGICFIDREARFYELNPAGLRMFSCRDNREFAALDQDQCFFASAADRLKLLNDIQASAGVKDYGLSLLRRDGAPVHVLLTAGPEKDEHGEIIGFRGIIRDISEKKELENRVMQAQKLESLGLMAGGLAHDFNNILGSIVGYASILKRSIELDGQGLAHLEAIERNACRASDLTGQLLAFARGGQYDVKSLDLNAVIEGIKGIIQPTFGKLIALHLDLSPDLPVVEADFNQIQQVILNLCVNSRDAIPESGHITIRTWLQYVDALLAEKHQVNEGLFVAMSVADSGSGIPVDMLERIFDPFFTTKGQEKGTGLGLPMVYGVIKNHGGFVQVESAVGQGATFTVLLPAGSGLPAEMAVTAEEQEELARGRESILIIDDEDDIREMVQEMLQLNGYRTMASADPHEGLELYAGRRREIDMIILDLIMPGLGGAETFERLQQIDPGVRVLVSSGYQEDETVQRLMARGVLGFIQKPYNMEKLTSAVRRVLDHS